MLWFKISSVNFFLTSFIIDVCIHFNVTQIFFLANQKDEKNVNFETYQIFFKSIVLNKGSAVFQCMGLYIQNSSQSVNVCCLVIA